MIKKRFLIIFSLLFVVSVKSQLLINEYSAANFDSFTDNYGEYEDWIELFNPSPNSIDLAGWAISDKSNNPLKWIVPSSFNIPAGGVAVIYCSGRDEVNNGSVHSNFKITQTKDNEVIMLSDPLGVLQDSIRVNPNQTSHSRGRETDGSPSWRVFVNATPNTPNTGAMLDYASKPVFSQIGGYYNGPINIVLSSPDSNVTIYYSTNGDPPNNTSNQYTNPINISTTSVVKAVAYSSDPSIPPSFTEYHTFFINDTHTIPILSISGYNGQGGLSDLLDGGWGSTSLEPEGTVEWFDKNGVLLDKGRGEFNKHGNDSWAYDQRGFDFIMRDQFGYNHALQDKIFSTKSRDKFQRLIVKSAANDNYPFAFGGSGAHIRDAYVQHLSQIGNLRLDERSTSSCILYLDGNYWGVYEMREKVDDHDFTDYYYDQDKNNLQFLKTWGGTWTEYGAPNAQIDWDNFVNFVTTNPMSIQANYNIAKSQYNTGSLIDYFLLNAYVVCQDWLNWNTAWWRGMDPNGDKKKWRYTLWDMDNTFDHGTNYTGIPSSDPNAEPCDPSTLGNTGGQGHVPIWNEMLTNQEFHDDYINRWQDLANGPLSCSFMIHILDSMIAVIEPEMPRQISTWGGSFSTWEDNVQDLRNFILARCDSMNAGFVDCDTAITGIYDVTVEIIGVGEIEMSNDNIINDLNTPFTDERFGGITLPFEVKSGPFDRWEVISNNNYVYDPYVDTLAINLQDDILIRAYFVPPIPTRDIVYDIDPPGTNSSIDINGVNTAVFPTSINYIIGDTVNLVPNIDPLYGFSYWSTDSVTLMPGPNNPTDSFYATNHDNITLHLYLLPIVNAFISGNDTICENDKAKGEVSVSFSGTPPFTFSYSVNGIIKPQIFTSVNPYIIQTKEAGFYTLNSFSDANEVGGISGEAIITVLPPPKADFEAQPDTMSTIYTTAQFIDLSIGNIDSWLWDFGDNTNYNYTQNPLHTFPDSIGLYQINLITTNKDGCSDTTTKEVFIKNDYWMYIPNSFTPDSDGVNDKFCIAYEGVREETFIFNIYNRFSEVIFSTNNIQDLNCLNGWDGTNAFTGEEVPMGIYIYNISYQDHEGWKHQDISKITLVR